MFILLVFLIAFTAITLFFGYFISAPKYSGPVSDHFDGSRFINLGNIRAKGFREVIKWMVGRKRGEWQESKNIPHGERLAERIFQGIRITFINHSTFLIQVDGLNMITDPVWSQRTSPMQSAGPKLMRSPGTRV